MAVLASLAGIIVRRRNGVASPWRSKYRNPRSAFDVLLGEMPQERTLAASGFAEHRDVHGAARLCSIVTCRRVTCPSTTGTRGRARFPRPCFALAVRAGGSKSAAMSCSRKLTSCDAIVEGCTSEIGNKRAGHREPQGQSRRPQ